MSGYYYDRQGDPITLEEWTSRYAEDDRRVAKWTDGSGEVSTVFLGLNQNFGDGPPLIFETMIFEDGPLDTECWRYSTEAEALAGHEAAIATYQAALREREAVS